MVVGWGIIGIGRHTERFMARAIREAENSRLEAVCSRDLSRAQAFAARHGAESYYDSYARTISDPKVDAIYVASPNSLHREHTVMAAEAGKHVLCEKPMATSLEDCSIMIRACRRKGVKLGIGFHLRHHPAHVLAKKTLQGEECGKIALIQGQWSMGSWGATEPSPRPELSKWWEDPSMVLAGSLVSTGVHVIDLFRFILTDEIVSVSAFTSDEEKNQLDKVAIVHASFQRGALGTLVSGRVIPGSKNDFVVYGSKARISIKGSTSSTSPAQMEILDEEKTIIRSFSEVDVYKGEISDFNRAIIQDCEPAATGLDGLRANEVLDSVLRSKTSGKAVSVEHREPP